MPSLSQVETARKKLSLEEMRAFTARLFGDDVHATTALSLGNAAAGVLDAAVLSVHAIGQAYARLSHKDPKHGVKQVDRMLSNANVSLATLMPLWVRFVVAARTEMVLALDWTEFDDDDHATLCAYGLTGHGRATPLMWKTVKKSSLKGQRTAIEHRFIEALHEAIAPEVRITLLADRGFGDQKLYRLLEALGWDYAIRFRGAIAVESREGSVFTAGEWVKQFGGRATKLLAAKVTADKTEVPAVVLVHDKKMKEPWCLASSRSESKASEIVALYGRRFCIEETFRDTKDLRFGMGLKATHIGDPERRDRLLLLVAMAMALLTLLGAAAEQTGLDRKLKVNTSKTRTHSLFRQGLYWYSCIPTMRTDWLEPLMTAFDHLVRQHAVFQQIFGVI